MTERPSPKQTRNKKASAEPTLASSALQNLWFGGTDKFYEVAFEVVASCRNEGIMKGYKNV